MCSTPVQMRSFLRARLPFRHNFAGANRDDTAYNVMSGVSCLCMDTAVERHLQAFEPNLAGTCGQMSHSMKLSDCVNGSGRACSCILRQLTKAGQSRPVQVSLSLTHTQCAHCQRP